MHGPPCWDTNRNIRASIRPPAHFHITPKVSICSARRKRVSLSRTGLGLSQVYGIAQHSGGTARIESIVGRGTTVEIWLPLADPSARCATPECEAGEKVSRNAHAKILVVEDDPGVRQFIVESLEMSGYQVTQAEHGYAALDQLETSRPDLMIVDFLIPGMNGAELVEKATAKYPQLPIILAPICGHESDRRGHLEQHGSAQAVPDGGVGGECESRAGAVVGRDQHLDGLRLGCNPNVRPPHEGH